MSNFNYCLQRGEFLVEKTAIIGCGLSSSAPAIAYLVLASPPSIAISCLSIQLPSHFCCHLLPFYLFTQPFLPPILPIIYSSIPAIYDVISYLSICSHNHFYCLLLPFYLASQPFLLPSPTFLSVHKTIFTAYLTYNLQQYPSHF